MGCIHHQPFGRWSSPLVSSVIFSGGLAKLFQTFAEDLASVESSIAEMKSDIPAANQEMPGLQRSLVKKPHSKRVEKMWNYTRNEWRRCETTLETSGEDIKVHSKQAEKT